MIEKSICITHYNNGKTVSTSLASIFSQIDDSYEVVVVDNMSDDGSEAILEDLASKGQIHLVKRKCSRGAGRELAFENSKGRYILANMDMDDTFRPGIAKLMETYHRECEGKLLLAIADKERWSQNITVGPRDLIAGLGGWRDLQWGEDWDLWRRASRRGSYRWTTFALAEEINLHLERNKPLVKLRQRYARYRDTLRLGRAIFSPGESRSLTQRTIAGLARLTRPFYESFDDGLGPFDPYDSSCYIEPDAE
jgi:glycosyltransferase involved in cell wall biosynthesis